MFPNSVKLYIYLIFNCSFIIICEGITYILGHTQNKMIELKVDDLIYITLGHNVNLCVLCTVYLIWQLYALTVIV